MTELHVATDPRSGGMCLSLRHEDRLKFPPLRPQISMQEVAFAELWTTPEALELSTLAVRSDIYDVFTIKSLDASNLGFFSSRAATAPALVPRLRLTRLYSGTGTGAVLRSTNFLQPIDIKANNVGRGNSAFVLGVPTNSVRLDCATMTTRLSLLPACSPSHSGVSIHG